MNSLPVPLEQSVDQAEAGGESGNASVYASARVRWTAIEGPCSG